MSELSQIDKSLLPTIHNDGYVMQIGSLIGRLAHNGDEGLTLQN